MSAARDGFRTRTLPSGKKCSRKESAFIFNQRGPQGPAGISGLVLADDGGVAPQPGAGWKISPVKTATITVAQPCKLLVLDTELKSASINNTTAEPITYYSGVFVDGKGVPGTASFKPGQAPAGVVTTLSPSIFRRG